MNPNLFAWIWTAVALVLICGAGAAIGVLLGRRIDSETTPLGLGRSFLLGIAFLSVLLHLPLAAFGRITHRDFAFAMALCAALTLWFVWRHLRPAQWWPAVLRGWVNDLPFKARLFAFVMLFVGLLLSLAAPLTTYDARTAFALKACILYDTGELQGEDFQDINRVHFNAHYPLLVPLIEAETFWLQGSYDDHALRLVFLMFVASLASLVVGEIRRFESRTVAALWGLALLATPAISGAFEGAGMSGSADIPLACFITAAVIELGTWLRNRDSRDAVLAGIFFGAAATTKPEGAIWVGMIGLALVATFALRRTTLTRSDLKAAALAAGCLFIAFGLGAAIRHNITPSPYYRDYSQALRWDWLVQLGRRPLDVLPYTVQQYFTVGLWNLVWPCVVLGMFVGRKSRVPADVWFTRAAVLILFAAMLGIFVITPYHVQFQLRTALGRLSAQFLPLAMILLAENLSASGWVAEAIHHWNTAWDNTKAEYVARVAAETSASQPAEPIVHKEIKPASLAA